MTALQLAYLAITLPALSLAGVLAWSRSRATDTPPRPSPPA